MEQNNFNDYKKIFDQCPQAIIIFDINGYIIELNGRIYDWLGYNIEEIKGMHLKDVPFLSKEGKIRATEIFKKRLAREQIAPYEMEFFDKTGKKAMALISAKLVLDDEGNPKYDIVTIVNITNRKIIESRYQTIFEYSSEAIMTLEAPDWKFTSGNPATIKMFGAKDEKDFIAHSPWEYSPEKQPNGKLSQEQAKLMIEKTIKEGSASFEWVHKKISGEEFMCIVKLMKIDAGGDYFIQATVQDISNEKKQEIEIKQKQKNLEEVNKFMVGRELKMIELKEENAKLREQLEKLKK